MTRRDLGESDLAGLDATYRAVCAQRRWTAEESNSVMQQPLQRGIRRAKRLRARKDWVRPAIWISVLVAGPFAWALVIRLAGG